MSFGKLGAMGRGFGHLGALGTAGIPANALLDENGQPIRDENNQIITAD